MIVDNLSTSHTRKKPPQWMAICFRSAKVALKNIQKLLPSNIPTTEVW